MPSTFVCRKCGKQYTSHEFEESRFCRTCEVYLMPASMVKKLAGRAKAVKHEDKASCVGTGGFPVGYELRRGQMEFINDVSRAAKDGQIFLGNAPCGIGKSLASVLAILPSLQENRLVITFRTRSQLYIYLKELKALGIALPTVSLFSKQSMCPLRVGGNLSYHDFFDTCKRLKENCEPLHTPYCRYYLKNLRRKKESEALAADCARRIVAPDEATTVFVRQGFCAYEALRSALSKARIFLGTYHYIFNPQIRRFMLKDFGVGLDKIYLIVDEAHNIPSFARELLSDDLTETTLARAVSETGRFGIEDVSSIRELLELLDDQVFQRAKRMLQPNELKQLQPRDVGDLYLEWCGISGSDAAEVLMEYGESVKQKREELGQENLLSYNYRVGEFLKGFFQKSGEKYTHLITRDWKGEAVLEVRSFDGREITDPVLTQAHGSVLMSGSLSPPHIYRDLILHDPSTAAVKEFDSPFPAENRLILAAADVSSRFELRTRAMFEKWKHYIEAISRANEGNVAFFFTSYDMMQSTLKLVTLDRTVIVEQRKTRRSSVLSVLHKSPNNALFGVMGGKLSEGIDYPDNVLTCVVSIGLPYATWDIYQKGLIGYYNLQFPEQGETYAYLTPAVLRLIQASGRVHRSPRDRGCIVILDARVTRPSVKGQLPKFFQQEMSVVEDAGECARKIAEFWEARATRSAKASGSMSLSQQIKPSRP